MTKNPHAIALGRKGGRVRSEAKKASGKLNMEKARAAKATWSLRRLGFRCYCDGCIGKFWQAQYGESWQDFRVRYNSVHN